MIRPAAHFYGSLYTFDRFMSADYDESIDHVCGRAVDRFRGCQSDVLEQMRACCTYFIEGERVGISHGELIDFLGVSTPSVLDDAGYSDDEAQRLMDALRFIEYDSQQVPRPPSSLPDSF